MKPTGEKGRESVILEWITDHLPRHPKSVKC